MRKNVAVLAALSILSGMITSPEFSNYYNSDDVYAKAVSDTENPSYVTDDYTIEYTVNGDEATICSCSLNINRKIYETLDIGKLEIPEKIDGYTVTQIADYAFNNVSYKELSLPDTIKKIGSYSLGYFNYSPEVFSFPAATEVIGNNVFSTINADKFILPEYVSSIADDAFEEDCIIEVDPDNKYFEVYNNALVSKDHSQFIKYFGDTKINSYCLPVGTKEIFSYAFKNADIKNISIPDTVESIGKSAFEASKLETVTIPENVKEIKNNTFYKCKYLKEVNLNEGLEHIGEYAFCLCYSLESVSLPESLKKIDSYAFSQSGLNGKIIIPSEMSEVAENVFESTGISDFEVSADNKIYSSENGILFDKQKKTLICCPANKIYKSYIIPDSVTKIGDRAFYNCSGIKEIVFPESVKEIGQYSFYNCTSVKSLKLPANLFSIGDYAFANCSELTDMELPYGLESIGSKAFQNTALKTITFPETVHKIGEYVFLACEKLETVYLHYSQRGLESKLGVYVRYLEDENTCISDGVVYSADKSVLLCYPIYLRNDDGEFTVPESVTKIASEAFSGSRIRKIILSENVSSIDDYAFRDCFTLEEFDYNGSTPDIGKGIFYGCFSLFNIELPENITVIPENTFAECYSLKTFRIPDGVEELKKDSMPCSMDEVYIPSSVSKIDKEAFNTYRLGIICAEKGTYAEKFAKDNEVTFIPDAEAVYGDVNEDGTVNILDLIYLKSYFLNKDSSNITETDVNSDGKTSISDLVKLTDFLHGKISDKGFGDVKLLRDHIVSDSVTAPSVNNGVVITNEEQLNSVFEGYFDDSTLKDKYIGKYRGYLDDYVIFSYLYKSSWRAVIPVASIHVYSMDDTLLHYSIEERATTYDNTVNKDTGYLYTVLLPRRLYKGQVGKYTYYQNMMNAGKPVIYLYPEEETEINVKVELDDTARFTCTYPEYPDETGWTVTAEPDSTLYDDKGNEYPYLFWEASTVRDWDMSKGFVVKGEDTQEFLKKKLSYLGLEPKEYTEFISFWLPKMKNNKYNLISFQTDDYEEMAGLIVTPEPESVLRVFMTYKSLDEWIDIPEQNLPEFVRSGYTLVEWGGSEIK